MSNLIKAMGSEEKFKALLAKIRESVGADVESLSIDAEVELDVVYRVEARVTVGLRDLELDSFRPVYVFVEGEKESPSSIQIVANNDTRQYIGDDEVRDAIHDEVGMEIPHELDDFNVEVLDVVVDDYDVVEVDVDPASQDDIEAWNKKVDIAKVDV